MKKRIALVIAHNGYQPIEYGTTKKVLEQAGAQVITVSNNKGFATDKDGKSTKVDMTLEQISLKDYDAIFLIGGPGALDHLDNQVSYTVMREAADNNKPFGAICIASRILAKAGVLKKKKATGWDGDDKLSSIFAEHGVEYIHQDVVTDGIIITATDPSAAQAFGEAIVTLLQL